MVTFNHAKRILRDERYIVLAVVIAVHAMLLLLLTIRYVVISEPQQSSLTIISLALPQQARTPPTPIEPPPVVPLILPEPEPLPIPQPAPLAVVAPTIDQMGPATLCAPPDAITKAMLLDADAMRAIADAPRSTRSIAEAIVIWNAGWSEAAASDTAPLAPVRAVVERTLATLPGACLATSEAGPRLLPIMASRGTTLLVFGSGTWSWGQLTAPPLQFPTP